MKVFKLIGGVWTLQGSPIIGDADGGGLAGWSVSLSSDGLTVAIGAPGYTFNEISSRGQVKVYKLVSGEWALQGSPIIGDADLDLVGWSVSLSSDGLTVAIGAVGYSSYQGQVKVYKLESGVWALQGSPISGEATDDQAGYSVSLSSDGLTLAMGAIGNSSYQGQVKVFKLVGGVWTLQGSPIPGVGPLDRTGFSVSLSSDGLTVALGVPNNSSTRGLAKVYKLVSGAWTLQGSPILGDDPLEQAGYSVSLSSDGLTLAMGTPFNSSGRGLVKVFKLVGGEWVLQGSPILGGASNDRAGGSVSLSSDGLTVALGAPFNASGQAKVYRFCNLSVSITPSSPSICPGTSLTLAASAGADNYTWSNGQTTPTITVSPTSTTPYSVTATNANGACSVTAITTVTVHPPTVASLSSSSSALTCASASVTLTAGGGISYGFSAGVTTLASLNQVRINSPGSYSVVVTDANGCSATATTTISLNNSFVALAGAASSTVLVGGAVSLSASGGTTYQWLAPSGTFLSSPTTDPVVSAIVPISGVQTFTVVVSNGSLCSQRLTVSVTATGSSSASPDLTVNLELPQANFASSGAAAIGNFLINVFEVAGLPTSSGNATITVTAPVGYTLAFISTLTSINVSGGEHNPVVVNNSQWTVTQAVSDRQLTLTMNSGAFIVGGGESSLGFSITRTTANSGSSANVTVNVADDPTGGYDGNLNNNI